METSASLEDVVESVLLSEQRVHQGGVGVGKRSLAEISKSGKDSVESLESAHAFNLVFDSLEDFRQENEIENNRSSQERIFANIVQYVSLLSTEENLALVFIHSLLGISSVRNVLNNDFVVNLRRFRVKNLVRSQNIVNAGFLADFLRSELSFRRQIHAVVVTKMVVRHNRLGLKTSAHQEFSQRSLNLSLSRLEVITDDEDILLLSEFNNTWHKSVLGRAIDVAASFQNSGNSVHSRSGDFSFGVLNCLKDICSGVVDTSSDFAESLSVCSPKHNNLIDVVGFLEFADVTSDLFQVFLLVVSFEDIVSSDLLVRCDEVLIVDGLLGDDFSHVSIELLNQIVFEHLSAAHGFREVHAADIPATNDNLIRVDQRQDLVHGEVDFLRSVAANLHSRGLSD